MQLVPGDAVTGKQRVECGIAEEIVECGLPPRLLHGALLVVGGV
jgi:hypothetical protein